MTEAYSHGSAACVPAKKAPATFTLQCLPQCSLHKPPYSYACLQALVGISYIRSSQGIKRSHHASKNLQASHLQCSFPCLLPISRPPFPWHYPSATLMELKSTSCHWISLVFLFVLKQSCDVSRKGVGEARFCLLSRAPTRCGSGSILHRRAVVVCNCSNNHKS